MDSISFFRQTNKRGSALILALAAMAVVSLSIILLLGYLSNMINQQNYREATVQARFAQESAVDGFQLALSRGEVDLSGNLPSFELGGMNTRFTIEEINGSGIHSTTFNFPSSGVNQFATAPHAALAALRSNSSDLFVEVYDPVRSRGITSFEIDASGASRWLLAGASEGLYDIGVLGAVLMDKPSEDQVILLCKNGTQELYTGNISLWRNSSIVSLSLYNGSPVLTVTNGKNQAEIIILDEWQVMRLKAPEGTCPVITGSGLILASSLAISPGGIPVFTSLPVNGWIEEDADGDGRDDIVWFSDRSIAAWLASRDTLFVDIIDGMELESWGILDANGGLVCTWISAGGFRMHKRLSWSGFHNLPVNPFSGADWSGRVFNINNWFTGRSDGNVVLRNSIASVDTILCSEDALFYDFYGDGIDVLTYRDEKLEIFLNVLRDDGTYLNISARTYGKGVVLDETYTFAVFPGENGSNPFNVYRIDNSGKPPDDDI